MTRVILTTPSMLESLFKKEGEPQEKENIPSPEEYRRKIATGLLSQHSSTDLLHILIGSYSAMNETEKKSFISNAPDIIDSIVSFDKENVEKNKEALDALGILILDDAKTPEELKEANVFSQKIATCLSTTSEKNKNITDKISTTHEHIEYDFNHFINETLAAKPALKKSSSAHIEQYIAQINQYTNQINQYAKALAMELRNEQSKCLIGLNAKDFQDKVFKTAQHQQITGLFNNIVDKIQDDILFATNKVHQVTIAEFYAQTYHHAMENKDYATASAIYSAFLKTNIRRLPHISNNPTIKAMQADAHKKLKEQHKNPTYKKLEANSTPDSPVIPFLGATTSSLTFINDGNPDMKEKQWNDKKFTFLGREMQKIQSLIDDTSHIDSSSPSNIIPLLSKPHLDDKQGWEISNAMKGRGQEEVTEQFNKQVKTLQHSMQEALAARKTTTDPVQETSSTPALEEPSAAPILQETSTPALEEPSATPILQETSIPAWGEVLSTSSSQALASNSFLSQDLPSSATPKTSRKSTASQRLSILTPMFNYSLKKTNEQHSSVKDLSKKSQNPDQSEPPTKPKIKK